MSAQHQASNEIVVVAYVISVLAPVISIPLAIYLWLRKRRGHALCVVIFAVFFIVFWRGFISVF